MAFLRKPCDLRDFEEEGTKPKVATSTLPSGRPTSGRNRDVSSSFSGGPGSPEEGTKSEVATSPLPSRGPRGEQNPHVTHAFYGVPRRGDKTKSGYISPAFSGAHKWAELLRKAFVLGGAGVPARGDNHKWLHEPCLLGGAEVHGIPTPPMHSLAPLRREKKTQSGHITPPLGIAVSPLRSQGSPEEGTKSKVATSTLPSPYPRFLGAWGGGAEEKTKS